MNKSHKQYDLESRTLHFAMDVRAFIKLLHKSIANFEDSKQVVRSSGSVGANYIEANDSLGSKDFLMKIRISRKEAKETVYWLNLLEVDPAYTSEHERLIQEATELMLIFGAILRNASLKQ